VPFDDEDRAIAGGGIGDARGVRAVLALAKQRQPAAEIVAELVFGL